MAKLTKQESRERWSQLRDLICAWDPIGVMDDPEWPHDEYDCLVGPVMRILESGAGPNEIAKYLRHEIESHFGLASRYREFDAFAAQLRAWFDQKWSSSTV